MNISNFDTFLEIAKAKGPARIAAAGPAKAEVLESLKRAQEEGIAELTFIGDTAWIFQMANRAELNMSKVEMIHEPQLELPAAQAAVDQAKTGKAHILVNGYVSSNHMLQAAMDPLEGLRTERAFSQLTAIELPSFSKLLFITDTGLHAKPGPREKRDILANALDYLKNLGIEEVLVAILKGNPIIEIQELKNYQQSVLAEEMALLLSLQEEYPGLTLLGPMSLEESMKGEEIPDLFLVPNAEAGQVLSHALNTFSGGKAGHVILGGEAPLVLIANNPTTEQVWRSILMALASILQTRGIRN